MVWSPTATFSRQEHSFSTDITILLVERAGIQREMSSSSTLVVVFVPSNISKNRKEPSLYATVFLVPRQQDDSCVKSQQIVMYKMSISKCLGVLFFVFSFFIISIAGST